MKYLDGKHPFRVIFTGQHEHLVENLPNHYDVVHLKIQDGKNRLDSIVSSVMNLDCFENVTHLMTQGDTTSAFAMSLAAFHRKIKVIHLEAGLRTYDMNNPYPEEANRQLISRIADIHLCPTKLSRDNLEVEMAPGKKYVVGNTVLDNIVNVPVTYSNEVLITMHRRENHDIIPQWFKNLEQATLLDKELRFVFVSHPNPNVQQHLGELQEESSFLRKYSIVCRKVTERKSGVGKWAKLCDLPGNLIKLIEETNLKGVPPNDWVCPYGDGKSSEKVYKVLKECGVFDV
jgi:UDP-N-acetylglucosamine 2-epimerase